LRDNVLLDYGLFRGPDGAEQSRWLSTSCSAACASQQADAADSASGKLHLPPASLLIRSALAEE